MKIPFRDMRGHYPADVGIDARDFDGLHRLQIGMCHDT